MSRETVTSRYETEYIVRPVPDFASQSLMRPIDIADRCKGYVKSFPSEQHVLLLLLCCPLREDSDIGELDSLHAFHFVGRSRSGKIGEFGALWWRVWGSRQVVTALCCRTYIRGLQAIQEDVFEMDLPPRNILGKSPILEYTCSQPRQL